MLSAQDIKDWLKINGKSRQWLAEKTLSKKRTVDGWLSDGNPIPEAKLRLIEKLVNGDDEVSLELSEEFEMRLRQLAEEAKKTIDQIVMEILQDAAKKANRQKRGRYVVPDETDLYAAEEETSTSYYEAEVLGNIAAGDLMEGDSVPEPVRIYRPLQKGEYVVRVNGRSMEPTIPDGSRIVLKKYYGSDIPPVGTIVEYNDGRGVTLKRLGKRGGDYVFESVNPAYPVIEPMDGGCISALYVETLPE